MVGGTHSRPCSSIFSALQHALGQSLFEDEKSTTRTVGVGEIGVLGTAGQDMRLQEFRLGEQRAGDGPWFGPALQVGGIDIGGDVLSARVLVNLRSFEALLEEIGAERAAGAAVIERGGRGAVVDGKHAARLPKRQPPSQPLAVGVMDFDDLPWRIGLGEERGVGQGIGGKPDFAGRSGRGRGFEVKFRPTGFSVPEAADGEGIDEFVGIDQGTAVGGPEGIGDGAVPKGVFAEAGLLDGREPRGCLYEVQLEAAAGQPWKVA